MAFVVLASYVAKPGEEENVAAILRAVAPLSREEPGCLAYEVHDSVDDPTRFLLYEQYEDETAYQSHQQTDHFRDLILGGAVPKLDSRQRQFFRTLDQ